MKPAKKKNYSQYKGSGRQAYSCPPFDPPISTEVPSIELETKYITYCKKLAVKHDVESEQQGMNSRMKRGTQNLETRQRAYIAECGLFMMLQKYNKQIVWNTHQYRDQYFERRKRPDISDFIEVRSADLKYRNLALNVKNLEQVGKAYVLTFVDNNRVTAPGWIWGKLGAKHGKSFEHESYNGKTSKGVIVKREDLFEMDYLFRMAAQ